MSFDQTLYTTTPGGQLAYRKTSAVNNKTGMVWFGGLRSDMLGGKATALHQAAIESDRPFLRFDYSGHGESEHAFEDTTITDWQRDGIYILDHLVQGDCILVGSSMGGWTSLLAALARPEKVKGLVLIAPAPDFTERLMLPGLDPQHRKELEQNGEFQLESYPGEPPYILREALFEAGRQHLITDMPIDLGSKPVRIIQGGLDDVVPPSYAQELVETITSPDVHYTLIKDGDHRLSRPEDLDVLVRTALDVCDQIDGQK